MTYESNFSAERKTLADDLLQRAPGECGFIDCERISEKHNAQSRIAATAKKLGVRVKTHRMPDGVSYQVIA